MPRLGNLYGNPVDTRKYSGFIRRIGWRFRRYVERKVAYTLADVDTYKHRARFHGQVLDGTIERRVRFERYLMEYQRSRFLLHFVWLPIARLVGVPTKPHLFSWALPGDRSVADWLDRHAFLSIAETGSTSRHGLHVEWFSLDPAPWSGQREDWLLWMDEYGELDVDGPMNSLQAQAEFMSFDAECQEVDDFFVGEAYSYPDGRYPHFDPGQTRAPAMAPALATAASLTAVEVGDSLFYPVGEPNYYDGAYSGEWGDDDYDYYYED